MTSHEQSKHVDLVSVLFLLQLIHAWRARHDTGPRTNLTNRAGNSRKAMGMAAKESEGTRPKHPGPEILHAGSQSASLLVQLGLAAFAISAYIRSTLCPALQSYIPQRIQPQSQISFCMI